MDWTTHVWRGVVTKGQPVQYTPWGKRTMWKTKDFPGIFHIVSSVYAHRYGKPQGLDVDFPYLFCYVSWRGKHVWSKKLSDMATFLVARSVPNHNIIIIDCSKGCKAATHFI